MIIIFLTGLIVGLLTSYVFILLSNQLKSFKKSKHSKKIFIEFNEKLISNQTIFRNRIKNSVLIETTLNNFGIVMVIYMMDKEEIWIFKEDKFITSSIQIKENNFINKIIFQIQEKHNHQINDVIEVMGIQMSKEYLNSQFNQQIMKFSNLKKSEEENNYNIDQILDKISATGLESLTKEELEFLNNYK
jgi:hypothetical protein